MYHESYVFDCLELTFYPRPFWLANGLHSCKGLKLPHTKVQLKLPIYLTVSFYFSSAHVPDHRVFMRSFLIAGNASHEPVNSCRSHQTVQKQLRT